MLKAINIGRRVRQHDILHGISLEVAAGSTVAVLGPSGSGKTTLLRLIMGLDRLDQGELFLGDDVLARAGGEHCPPEQRQMSMVFQEFTLLPHLNVIDNIAFGLKRPAAATALIDDLIDMLELGSVKKRRIGNLSGGEQQRVALARSLAIEPKVLLLDEPFSNVDPGLRERLQRRLKERIKQLNTTVLLATHDQKEAFLLSERICIMRAGRLVEQGSPQALYKAPRHAWVAEFFGEANILTGAEWSETGLLEGLPGTQVFMLRPEELKVVPDGENGCVATIESVEFAGFFQDLRLRTDRGHLLKVRDLDIQALAQGERVGLRLCSDSRPHPLTDMMPPESNRDFQAP